MPDTPQPPRRYRDLLKQRRDSDPDPSAHAEGADLLHELEQAIETLIDKPIFTPLDCLDLTTLRHMHALAQQLQPWHGRPYEDIPPDVQAHLHELHETLRPQALLSVWIMLKRDRPWLASWFEGRVINSPPMVPGFRVGRPRGTPGFRDAEEFREIVLAVMRLCEGKGITPTQERIADYLRLRLNTKSDNLDSRVRLLRLYCKKFQCPWAELRQQARTSP
jgi:hypothetical protein